MMLSFAKGGGHTGMPGLPGMCGRAQNGQGQQQAKGKRVSGNPAKRAPEQRAAARSRPPQANPFGVPAGAEDDFDPASLRAPADLSQVPHK
jgi:signal recognition particle subunit SRP54